MKKRLLLIAVVLAGLIAGALVTGIQRGKGCPAFVGVAKYELTGEDEQQVLAFIHYAIDASGSAHASQQRWPGVASKDEAVKAYAKSLTYRIRKDSGRRFLEIWCLASTGATAADGPTFPGFLWYADKHSVPSMHKGPLVSGATTATREERFLYGLGLFPPGRSIASAN